MEAETLTLVPGQRYATPEGGNDAGDESVRSRKCRQEQEGRELGET